MTTLRGIAETAELALLLAVVALIGTCSNCWGVSKQEVRAIAQEECKRDRP
jgi:hypothetical protein